MQVRSVVFISGILYLGFANGAASSSSSAGDQRYTSNDYLVFCVMQQVAQKYFDVIDNANKETQQKFERDLHSMQDMRDSVPFDDGLYDIAQGLLFEPKKCRFYSRFGCWRFGRNYMAKVPGVVQYPQDHTDFPKIDHWQKMRDAACAALMLKKMKERNEREIFEVCSCGEDSLPSLCLTRKEEVVERPEPHVELEYVAVEVGVAMQSIAAQSLSWSASLGDLFQSLTDWVNGEQEGDDETGEYVSIGEPVQSSPVEPPVAVLSKCKKKQSVSPELLKIWHELKGRYVAEQEAAEKENFIDL